MATVIIQKRKRKNFTSYMVFYKDNQTGEKKYYKTFRKFKEAQIAKQNLRSLIDNGEIRKVEESRIKIKLLSFQEVSEQKLVEWKKEFNKKKLSEATYNDYTVRLNVLKNFFGKKILCEVSKNDILEYQQHLLDKHSPATSNRYLFIIKQVIKHGLKINATKVDPSDGISYLNEDIHKRNKFITPTEIDRLIMASKATRAQYYLPALIYLGAEHGASKQEALNLKWSDIDFDFNGVGIIRLFRTKNKNERTEYLMPRTAQSLLDWKKHIEWARHRKKIKIKEAVFVFCRLDGTPIDRFDSAWNRVCTLAGIQDFHYHDLRHTFCSSLIVSGSDVGSRIKWWSQQRHFQSN
jgi:integrase